MLLGRPVGSLRGWTSGTGGNKVGKLHWSLKVILSCVHLTQAVAGGTGGAQTSVLTDRDGCGKDRATDLLLQQSSSAACPAAFKQEGHLM